MFPLLMFAPKWYLKQEERKPCTHQWHGNSGGLLLTVHLPKIDLKEAFLKIYLRAYQISQAPHNYSLLNNLFCYQCYKHFSLLTILILSDFHFFIGFDYNIFPTLFSSTVLYLIFSITLVNLLQS